MAKRIKDEEQKKLLQLFENSKSGNDDEVDALYNFLEEVGIDPDEVQEYLAVKNGPETEQEKRVAKKGVNPSHNRSESPITLENIAKAYGVNLDEREKGVGLAKYLKDNGVFTRLPGTTTEKYVNDQRNAFEQLGLNWDNVEDRSRLAKYLEYNEQNDERDSNAKEFEDSVVGKLLSIAAPRTYEQGMEDIRNGKEAPLSKYLKSGLVDAGENVLMTVGSPASGVVRVVGKAANVAPKVGAKIAGKGVQSAKALASQLADAAAVPVITEVVDDIAFDDENNERSEFSGADAVVGTGVNTFAPYFVGRKGGRLLSKIPGVGQHFTNVAEAVGETAVGKRLDKPLSTLWELNPGLDNLYINKAGKSGMAAGIPIVGGLVQPREEEKADIKKKKLTVEEKQRLWSKGFAVPEKGDPDYDEYKKWNERKKDGKDRLSKYLLYTL